MAVGRFKSGEFDPSAYYTSGYNKYKDRVWLRKAAAPSYSQPGTVVKNINYSNMTLPKVTWLTGYGPNRTEATEKAAKNTIKSELMAQRDKAYKEWVKKNPGAPPAIFDSKNPNLIVSDYTVNKIYQTKTQEQITKGIPERAAAPTSAYGSTLKDTELTNIQTRFKPLKKASERYDEAARMITERAKYDKALGKEQSEYKKYLTDYQSAFDALTKSLGQP